MRGADLHDGMETIISSSPDHSYVFVRVYLLSENGEVQSGYSMSTHAYTGGSIDFNEEEFVFDSVSQSDILRVSIHATSTDSNSSYSECGGMLLLPLSRLQDGVSVSPIN